MTGNGDGPPAAPSPENAEDRMRSLSGSIVVLAGAVLAGIASLNRSDAGWFFVPGMFLILIGLCGWVFAILGPDGRERWPERRE